MDVIVQDIEYKKLDNGYQLTYHLGCENMHKVIVPGATVVHVGEDTLEKRVVDYLIQQSETRYGQNNSN